MLLVKLILQKIEQNIKKKELREEKKELRKKFPISSELAKSGSKNVNPDYKKFTEKTEKIKKEIS